MTAPLRVGFLVSGLLHLAAVAAFSLPTRPAMHPVADEALPITLKLAVFQPPAEPVAAPEPPARVVAKPPSATTPPEPEPREAEPAMTPEPQVVQSEPESGPEPEPEPDRTAAAKVPVPSQPSKADTHRPPPPERPRQVVTRAPVVDRPDRSSAPAVRPATPAAVAKAEAPDPEVPVVDVQATRHYLAALAARIDRRKFYPRTSRRLGEQGIAVVGFVIQRNGELTDIHIVESSGHRRLDEAALKTLRRVTPFDRIPDAVDREQWPITVPIAFSLRG